MFNNKDKIEDQITEDILNDNPEKDAFDTALEESEKNNADGEINMDEVGGNYFKINDLSIGAYDIKITEISEKEIESGEYTGSKVISIKFDITSGEFKGNSTEKSFFYDINNDREKALVTIGVFKGTVGNLGFIRLQGKAASLKEYIDGSHSDLVGKDYKLVIEDNTKNPKYPKQTFRKV